MKYSMSSVLKLHKISKYKKLTSTVEDQIKSSKF